MAAIRSSEPGAADPAGEDGDVLEFGPGDDDGVLEFGPGD